MKNRIFSLLTAILCVLIIASFAAADAGLYPIGQQQSQSYPMPQYQNPQPQQQQQQPQQNGYGNPYYNNPYYNNPYYSNPYYNNPYYNYPYYPYGSQAPTQQPYNPQPNYNNQQQDPYYDPNSGYYFYPVQPQPYNPQPNYGPQQNQGNQNSNVQVYTQWGPNGTLDLTWTIKNVTNEDWGKKNIDIKCTGGTYLLTDPNRTLWDLPYTVNRNDKLTFTVNIRQPGPYDDALTFAIVAGSKTLYTFAVKPR